MSVGSTSLNETTKTYTTYNTPVEETKKEVTEEKNETAVADHAAVYEKSEEKSSGTYSINRMSAEERSALVDQLKADQENRQKQLMAIVQQMMSKQATSFSVANDDEDSIWRFLAKGDYTVDAATKEQAQKDVSEDGYYGVKQTSERLFDFASALAGDDVEKMKKMQSAIEEGYQQATKSWGKDLPDICKDTLEATNKLFEDYYASKAETGVATE